MRDGRENMDRTQNHISNFFRLGICFFVQICEVLVLRGRGGGNWERAVFKAPYYCFEFITYDTKRSFNLFYEQFFPKLSRLFALGLNRSLFFTNASKQPLDLKCSFFEKRFWWDFNYDKMERCGGQQELLFGKGKRIGLFKVPFCFL